MFLILFVCVTVGTVLVLPELGLGRVSTEVRDPGLMQNQYTVIITQKAQRTTRNELDQMTLE